MKEKLLSIIIPVYNVEQYIHSCIESLLRQGLEEDSYEIILIDDDTPDGSIEAIADLRAQHSNIKVLHQENQGPSAARNLGIRQATGQYILYVDSDDLVMEQSLKVLLDIALKENADLVVADYIEKAEEDSSPIHIQREENPDVTMMTGHQLFMDELSPEECYIWRTLYKKDYLKEIRLEFIEGISFEDIPYLQECYLKAGRCARVKYPFYIYRKRHGTLSTTINEKIVYDLNRSLEKIWQLAHSETFTLEERERLKDNMFAVFSKDLWYISHYPHLLKNRKAFVHDLKSRIPGLTFQHGRKQRMISWLFKMMPCTYLKIRSFA